MFFALGMERVEARLRQVAVGENDVEEFLEQARPNELRELFRHGFGRALELFRLRRRTPARRKPPQRAPLAITAGGPSPGVTARPMATQNPAPVPPGEVAASRSRAS